MKPRGFPLPTRSLARRAMVLGLALALVAGGAAGEWWWSGRARAATAGPAARTRLVAATVGTVSQTVAATGTVEPAHQASAAFQTGGTVTSVEVSVGQEVSKGDVLARLDPTSLRNAVDLASASVTAAEDQAASASGTVAVAQAAAQLASARQQLASAQRSLDDATLTAPISGTVSAVGLTVGSSVGSGEGSSSGGSSGGSGASGSGGAFGTGAGGGLGASAQGGDSGSGASSASSSTVDIIDPSSWVVDATVAAADLDRVTKGLEATITPQLTTGGAPVFGTVSSVGVVASSSSSGAAQFPVTIAVTGHPTGLHAGTTADVSIRVRVLQGVLTVPTAALSTQGGRTVVHVSRAGTTTVVPVTVGGIYGATTQVTAGLKEGDQVVVTMPGFVRAGTGTSGTGTGARRGGGFGNGFGGGGFGGGGFGGGGFGGGRGGTSGRG